LAGGAARPADHGWREGERHALTLPLLACPQLDAEASVRAAVAG
jgi:hypothetical protein